MLNATFGWGWADLVAALVIAVLAASEGRKAWRGDACCGPTIGIVTATTPDTTTSDTPTNTDTGGSTVAVACGCGDGCCATTSNSLPHRLVDVPPVR